MLTRHNAESLELQLDCRWLNAAVVQKVFDEFCSAAAQAPAQGGRLVFNLAGVENIDSTGLALLRHAYAQCAERDCEFMAINVSDEVLARMRLHRMDKIFPIGIAKSSKDLSEAEKRSIQR